MIKDANESDELKRTGAPPTRTSCSVLLIARKGAHKVRPGGTLLFMGGTGGGRPGIGLEIASTGTAALPP